MKKVVVFGAFDGIHEGHKKFLKQAKSLGDYLIAVIAEDHIIKHLKGHLPKINLAGRFKHLEKIDDVDEMIGGDAELGVWSVIEKHRPEVIALGYDQTVLKKELESYFKNLDYKPKIKVLRAYRPDKLKSSILAEKNNHD